MASPWISHSFSHPPTHTSPYFMIWARMSERVLISIRSNSFDQRLYWSHCQWNRFTRAKTPGYSQYEIWFRLCREFGFYESHGMSFYSILIFHTITLKRMALKCTHIRQHMNIIISQIYQSLPALFFPISLKRPALFHIAIISVDVLQLMCFTNRMCCVALNFHSLNSD